MSEMVERVAKAIFDGRWRANSWDQTSETFRADCRNMARAAIAAMREPTEAMCKDGEDSFDWDSSDTTGHFYIQSADPEKCWQAMLDAALKD